MMDDYVSREAAINDVKNLDDTMFVCVSKDECNGMRSMKGRAVSALERIPAADVRPVVLCRDCRWFYDGSDMKCCTNHRGVVITDENGFCHHAKPKNGGADG